MNLDFTLKSFESLTSNELYAILRLRSEVFVVEQDCVFLDMDGKDAIALHLMGWFEGKIVAYSRLFDANGYYAEASIGRVVIDADCRDKKWGHALLQRSFEQILTHFGQTKIKIGAQLYLKKFYEANGFEISGPMYLEDGIEHIEMIRL